MWQQMINLGELSDEQQDVWQQVLADKRLDELAADQIEAWQPVFEKPGLTRLSVEQITALGALIGATKNKTAAEIKQSEFFTSDAYRYICDSTPMQISAFVDLTREDAYAYGNLPALADLDDEAITFFRQLREQMSEGVLTLNVPFHGAKPLANAIRNNTSWTSLTLNYAGGDLGASEIIDALSKHSLLATLKLSCESFGASGLHMLARLLEASHRLQSLTVSACDGGGVYPAPSSHAFGDVALRIFTEALANSKALQQLAIHRPHYEAGKDGDWRVVADALIKNSSLAELDLSDCALSAAEVATIINALKHNGCKNLGAKARGLKRLALENNEVNADVCEAVAKMLKENNTLEVLALNTDSYHLELEASDFPVIKQAIYNALSENATLRQLTGFAVEDEGEVANDEPMLSEHDLSVRRGDLSPADRFRLDMAERDTDEYKDLIVELQIRHEQPGSGDEVHHEADKSLPKLSLLLQRNQLIYSTNQHSQALRTSSSDTSLGGLMLSGEVSRLFQSSYGAGAEAQRSHPASPGPGGAV
jgi:hypothetical protein